MTIIVLTALVLAYWKANSNARWWITYAGILTVLLETGVRINIIVLGLSIIVWKVIKDIFTHRKGP